MIDPAAIARARAAFEEDDILAHASRSDLYAPLEGYDELLAALIAARDLIDRGGSSADVWNLIDAAIPREQP